MKEAVIKKLDDIGVDVFRINLSHTEIKDLRGIIKKIKKYTDKPICLDTEGAQIRTSYIKNGKVFLEEGRIVDITDKKIIGSADIFCFNPVLAVEELKPGDLISVDFDSAILMVTEKKKGKVMAKVVSSGYMGSNKAVTVDRAINLPVFSEKDRKAVRIGLKNGVYHFALSFANSRSGVEEFRKIVGKNSKIISKIESKEGVDNLEEILEVSDAILIDRGDLSREEPIEKIPFLQKLIIKKANEARVSVYVATNLLESMVKNKKPTRAEAGDVVNTLMDGADGLVLAAETAIGDYPVNCAVMISKIVQQFLSYREGCSLKDLRRKESFLLIEPHGRKLVNRVLSHLPDEKELKGFKKLIVDEKVLLNAEQIAIGAFSPLEGFMTRDELDGVVEKCRLPKGIIWPLPIILQVSRDEAMRLKKGETVLLTYDKDNQPYALLRVEQVYSYNLNKMCKKVFGTLDMKHPGVAMYKSNGKYFVGGKIDLIRRLPSDCAEYEVTPKQARTIFENRGWSRVVAFHTRNVVHRAHEHIQMLALNEHHCDGLFVHPVIGPKKKGDYKGSVILKSYERMMGLYRPKGKVFLGAFKSYSRYAGPREAVFTALCRKNFGCSHFIVGRDHTGVKNYYAKEDSQNLFRKFGDIGIKPIFFNEMHYCRKCRGYMDTCSHSSRHILSISGTRAREMFNSGKRPPKWFMRKEVSSLIIERIKRNEQVFVE